MEYALRDGGRDVLGHRVDDRHGVAVRVGDDTSGSRVDPTDVCQYDAAEGLVPTVMGEPTKAPDVPTITVVTSQSSRLTTWRH